jgi:dimeric dUTPase (all-alpha-NTP-PPase superfamily)
MWININRGSFRIQNGIIFMHISEGTKNTYHNSHKIKQNNISCQGLTLHLTENTIESSYMHKNEIIPDIVFKYVESNK